MTVSLAYEPGRVAFAGRAATFQRAAAAGRRAPRAPGRARTTTRRRRALRCATSSARCSRPAAPRADPRRGGAAARGRRRARRARARRATRSRRCCGAGMPRGGDRRRARARRRRSPTCWKRCSRAAGDPVCARSARRRFARHRASGARLIGLLRCVPDARRARSPGRAGDLLAWLRAPGLLERPELADWLESARAARGRRERRAGAGAVGGAPLAAGARSTGSPRPRERGPAALIERAARELEWLFAAPRRGARGRARRRRARRGARAAGGPARAGRAARAGARRRRSSRRPTRRRSRELLEARGGLRRASAPAPGAVAVLDPLALRARRVRALFVCGLQEGVFPARAAPAAAAGRGGAPRGSRETSGLRAAASASDEAAGRRALSALRGGLAPGGAARAELARAPTTTACRARDRCSWTTSATCSTSSLSSAARRRARRRAGPGRAPPAPRRGRRGADGRSAGARGASCCARASGCSSALRERLWSASSLERWIGLPGALVRRARAARRSDLDPEPEPLARGGLAHAALKDTLEGLRERDRLGAADARAARARPRAAAARR